MTRDEALLALLADLRAQIDVMGQRIAELEAQRLQEIPDGSRT